MSNQVTQGALACNKNVRMMATTVLTIVMINSPVAWLTFQCFRMRNYMVMRMKKSVQRIKLSYTCKVEDQQEKAEHGFYAVRSILPYRCP